MKVKIQFTIDIDPEAWEIEFGGGTPVREDVKTYCEQSIRSQLGSLGLDSV